MERWKFPCNYHGSTGISKDVISAPHKLDVGASTNAASTKAGTDVFINSHQRHAQGFTGSMVMIASDILCFFWEVSLSIGSLRGS